jgi:hypothetical protein
MSLRRLGALFVALSIASFPLSAQADTDAPTPGMTGPEIDAQAQLNALKDIPPNSWAYQAIVDLVNDGIVVGYPDGTFKGNRPLTRYEAAVLTERAVQFLTKELANPQTAGSVSQADIETLRKLLDEFHGDIDALRLKVADLDSRLTRDEASEKTVAASEAQLAATQKNDEAAAARAKLGAVYLVRAGNFSEDTAAFTNAFAGSTAAPGCKPATQTCTGYLGIAPGYALTGGNPGTNAGSQGGGNKYLAGANTTGYGYQLLRILLDGTLDPTFSYHVRLENRYFWDTPSAQLSSSASTPGGTVNAVPAFPSAIGGYPANTTVRLNYAYMQYDDPSGFSASAGRLNETDGTLGLLYADQFNGGAIGIKAKGVSARVGYAYTLPAYSSGTAPAFTTIAGTSYLTGLGSQSTTACAATLPGPYPTGCAALPTQSLWAQLAFTPNKKLTLGAAYVDDINDQIADWDPSICSFSYKVGGTSVYSPGPGGACPAYAGGPLESTTQAGVNDIAAGTFVFPYTNLATGAVFGRYQDTFGKLPVSLEAEGSYRFGNDPVTGVKWQQPYAVWVQGKAGAYNATLHGAYVEGGYVGAGYNSLTSHSALTNGPSYDGQYQANANGYDIAYGGLHYWFSRYGRIGLVYQWSDALGGTDIPVASTTWAGAFLTHDISRGLFLQTYLQF